MNTKNQRQRLPANRRERDRLMQAALNALKDGDRLLAEIYKAEAELLGPLRSRHIKQWDDLLPQGV